MVYSREPRGPGVELGSPKELARVAHDATFGADMSPVALSPLALRLLASLHRRFNMRRLALAALREAPPGCVSAGAAGDTGAPAHTIGTPDDLTRNAPALSIRGEPVCAALVEFALSMCQSPRPDGVHGARIAAPVREPECDCQRRLWIEVFAAAEEALSLPNGTICFVTHNAATPESIK